MPLALIQIQAGLDEPILSESAVYKWNLWTNALDAVKKAEIT